MRPTFLARLVNGTLFDPVVFVRLLNQGRAILFDCGRTGALSNREILSLDEVFISHPHMDHLMGLDQVLRVILHRRQPMHLYGPEGITDKVISRLASYTWNLTRDYSFAFVLHEVREREILTSTARACEGFQRSQAVISVRHGATIASHPRYSVDAVILDHNIKCLGFVIREPFHVNIRGDAVSKRGYRKGPWISELKDCLMKGGREGHLLVETQAGPREIEVSELADELVVTSSGQKIAYVTDIRYSEENIARIAGIAQGADVLFIEAYYLSEREAQAYEKAHLTARQAGSLARMLSAKKVVPMHISPRYHDRAEEVLLELEGV
ncbi:MAG: MBL fold metallo-hydrolase [Deltaproteobacteria bacterium]|nr:MBL fold metallo-hydrolase [Deltaproteobacteria bacterium]